MYVLPVVRRYLETEVSACMVYTRRTVTWECYTVFTRVLRSSRYPLIGLTRNLIFAGRSPFPRAGHTLTHNILLYGVECNMVRYCTSGLLYFTRMSQRRVKYSPQVQCLTILHSTPYNDNILTPKEMAITVATRAGAAMVELHDHG